MPPRLPLLYAALVAALGPAALVAQAPRLGSVRFPVSAGPAARAEFEAGLGWLHSFEYARAATAFRRAQELEPGFAMAYWGEAMTHTHAVWNEQDVGAARQALARLAPDAAGRLARAANPRERRYLEAVEILYGDGPKPRRDTLYAQAMERLVREHPDDHEAKAFYALALIGLSQGVRDTATYVRAAAWADTVFRANGDHPGAAHYLIHAYDDPGHAARGLEAARAYSRIAPDAPHAQHMTTHIFLALGMWDEVVSQNTIAVNLTRRTPGHYSRWLLYGMLQQGRPRAAQAFLEELHGNLGGGGNPGQLSYLAWMRAFYVLLTGELASGPAAWQIPADRMPEGGRVAESYRAGATAWRQRDAAGLARAEAELEAAEARIASGSPLGGRDPSVGQARVMRKELEAMRLHLGGARLEAVKALQAAAAIEDSLPVEFGPPAIVEPSWELLGEMLLEMDPGQAQRAFQRSLLQAPKRSRSLAGLVRAAAAAGDRETAHRTLADLKAVWRGAEAEVRAELERLSAAVAQLR